MNQYLPSNAYYTSEGAIVFIKDSKLKKAEEEIEKLKQEIERLKNGS